MSYTAISHPRNAWQDRWSTPSLEELVTSLRNNHRRHFKHMLDKLEDFQGVERSLVWLGPGWKWTFQYNWKLTPANLAAKTGKNGNGHGNGHNGAGRNGGAKPAAVDRSVIGIPAVTTPTIAIPAGPGGGGGMPTQFSEASPSYADILKGDALCYLVPDAEVPRLCVPLVAEHIDRLPLKRLSKYVREGVVSAKCAVHIHWATWSPNTDHETDLLLDLVRRKVDMLAKP